MKALYQYKHGCNWFYIFFPNDICNREFKYRLLSLEEIGELKTYFQNKNALLTEFYSAEDSDFAKKLLKRMEDSRMKPYLFNKRWIPFAETAGGIHLMMDFDPDIDGTMDKSFAISMTRTKLLMYLKQLLKLLMIHFLILLLRRIHINRVIYPLNYFRFIVLTVLK